jgi:Cof subfamily protein (haloacid dehalogenase superfamily)
MKPHFRLAAIDLDGTLFGPDKAVSPENLAALRHLEAAGIEVVIATGRHRSRLQNALAHLPHTRWAITSQGAAVLDLDANEVVDAIYLADGETQSLMALGDQLGFTPLLYDDTDVWSMRHDAGTELYDRIVGGSPSVLSAGGLASVRAHKVVWIGAVEAVSKLPDHPAVRAMSLYHVQSLPGMYEFLPPKVTKGSGIAALARRLGVSPGEVVAFGDADNDIPMFEWAGTSFAMPHGTPASIAAATAVASNGPAGSAFARAVASLNLPQT